MIRVTIQMLPGGDESRARHLGTVEIANEGTGTAQMGNYKVRCSKMVKPTQTWKTGAVKGFNRTTRGPHDLLLLALMSVVGPRNRRLIDELKTEAEMLDSMHQDQTNSLLADASAMKR
jgi:hypothetical protein